MYNFNLIMKNLVKKIQYYEVKKYFDASNEIINLSKIWNYIQFWAKTLILQ